MAAVFDLLRTSSWPILGFALVLFLVSAVGLAVIVTLRVQRARMQGRTVSARPAPATVEEPPPAAPAMSAEPKARDDEPESEPRPAPVGPAVPAATERRATSGVAPGISPLQPALRFRPAAADDRPEPSPGGDPEPGRGRLLPRLRKKAGRAEPVSPRRRRRRVHGSRRPAGLRWIAVILGFGVLAMGGGYALTPWVVSVLDREPSPSDDAGPERTAAPLPETRPVADGEGESELRRAVEFRAADRYVEARAAYDRARALFARAGAGRLQADALVGQGDMALALRDYEAARLAYGEARSIYSRDGNLLGGANVTAALGRLELSVGRLERARELLEDARRLYVSEGSPQGEANVLLGLAEIAAPIDPALAREHLQDAAKLYELVGMPEWRDHALRRAETVVPR